MSVLPGCAVQLKYGDNHVETFVVQPEHYEQLKDMLDRGETGWVELKSVHGDGRALVKLENIADLFLATADFCHEREEWESHQKLTDS